MLYIMNLMYPDIVIHPLLTIKVLVMTIDALGHFKTGYRQHNGSACRVGEVRASTTSPMHDRKGFLLHELSEIQLLHF